MVRVVVTGIGMVTPLGNDAVTTWKNILAGKSGVRQIDRFVADGLPTTIAGELKDFDPTAKLDKKSLKHTDISSQMASYAAMEAIEDAGLDTDKIDDPYRFSVNVGTGVGGFRSFCETATKSCTIPANIFHRRISPYTVPMISCDSISANISMMLGAKGSSVGITSACASAGDAIHYSVTMIQSGQADVILSGGAESTIIPLAISSFAACRALSTRNETPETASRPFDKTRDGFVMSDAACVLVLESLEHAKKRGANILGEIPGTATTSDAHHATRPEPEARGATKAIELALARANAKPGQIDYINAHGTSTYWNDLLETRAIKAALGDAAYKVPVSSTKSMTGHTIGAAGAVELAFCLLAMRDSVVPPTINYNEADPDCDLNYVPNEAIDHPVKFALSNSFGFGGHNVCLTASKL